MPFLPCLLCGNKLEKRTDKNGKPYFVCDPCGIQLFVRRKQGIGLLEEVFRNIRRAAIPFRVHAKNLHEIRALIKEIGEVKTEINKIGFFFLSDEETRIRNALKTRLDNLLSQLDEMAEKNAPSAARMSKSSGDVLRLNFIRTYT